MKKFFALMCAVVLMGIGTTYAMDGTPEVGDKYVDVELKDANGNTIAVSDLLAEGKWVLIDFWATWCGPCRQAMKLIDEIKPELQKKGVVFGYLTGETSPLEKWEGMIATIEGDHYRITNKQWGALCSSLGLRGIPSYMILNKDGSTAYDNFKTGGYPGSEVLQNQAEVALTK